MEDVKRNAKAVRSAAVHHNASVLAALKPADLASFSFADVIDAMEAERKVLRGESLK